MRLMARVCRYSTAVASSLTKRPSEVFSRWNVQGMKAVNPPVSSCRLRTSSRWFIRCSRVSPQPNIMVAVVRTADCQGLQVLHRRSLFFDDAAQRGFFPRESPGNEGGEPARLFLKIAYQFQMVHPLFKGFPAAEHHGTG